MLTKKQLLKELKQFEMDIPDGFFKDCLFYHECVKEWFLDKLKEVMEEMVPEEKDMVGDNLECNCDGEEYCNCDFSFNDGFNVCRQEILDKLKQFYEN